MLLYRHFLLIDFIGTSGLFRALVHGPKVCELRFHGRAEPMRDEANEHLKTIGTVAISLLLMLTALGIAFYHLFGE